MARVLKIFINAVVISFGKPGALEVKRRKLGVADDEGRAKQDSDAPEASMEARTADRTPKTVTVQVRGGVKP